MATHKSAASFGIALAKRFGNMQGSLRDIHDKIANEVVDDHMDLTSGTVTTKTLRQAGHPFGRGPSGAQRGGNKKGRRSFKRLPINRQTGQLRASKFKTGPSGPDRTYRIGFEIPYARFVLSPTGTRKMVARGFYEEIRSRHRARKQGLAIAARKGLIQP
jgi:hypothetical protein